MLAFSLVFLTCSPTASLFFLLSINIVISGFQVFVETFTEVSFAQGIHQVVFFYLKKDKQTPPHKLLIDSVVHRGFCSLHMSGHRLKFLYGTQMLHVNISFISLTAQSSKDGAKRQTTGFYFFYNLLSLCLCCFSAKDFDSPMGASIF